MTPDWREITPERPKVTICIAAPCEINDDNPKIVVCSDRQLGSFLGTAEIALKQGDIRPGWRFLFAGNLDSARTALPILEYHFYNHSGSINETNILTIIETALNERRRTLVEQFMQGQLAVPYDWFLNYGKQQLPEIEHREILHKIAALELGVEFIIVGFAVGFPLVIETNERCKAIIKEPFAAIGEGRYLAHSVLMHRAQESTTKVSQSLYNVFEAKQYAQRIASVGNTTSLAVFNADGRFERVTPEGLKFLEKKYHQYGPKDIPKELNFDSSFLETVEPRWRPHESDL